MDMEFVEAFKKSKLAQEFNKIYERLLSLNLLVKPIPLFRQLILADVPLVEII